MIGERIRAIAVTLVEIVAVLVWGLCHWLSHVVWPGMVHFTWSDYGRVRTCIACGRHERRVQGHTRGGRPRYHWRAMRSKP